MKKADAWLPKDTMSMKEASRYLAMDEQTLTRMASERRIPALQSQRRVALLQEVHRQVAGRQPTARA